MAMPTSAAAMPGIVNAVAHHRPIWPLNGGWGQSPPHFLSICSVAALQQRRTCAAFVAGQHPAITSPASGPSQAARAWFRPRPVVPKSSLCECLASASPTLHARRAWLVAKGQQCKHLQALTESLLGHGLPAAAVKTLP